VVVNTPFLRNNKVIVEVTLFKNGDLVNATAVELWANTGNF
jgi:hypothetical protein